MNTPEQIVVSLELARKLKEAGWPQEDQHRWIEMSDKQFVVWSKSDWRQAVASDMEFDGFHGWNIVASAPTAEEILRRLPGKIHCHFVGQKWSLDCKPCFGIQGDTLANGAASTYIYLAGHDLLPAA